MRERPKIKIPGRVELVKIIAEQWLSAILVHERVPLSKAIILFTGLFEELQGKISDEQSGLQGKCTPETLVWLASRSPFTREELPTCDELCPRVRLNSAGLQGTKVASWRSLIRCILLWSYQQLATRQKDSRLHPKSRFHHGQDSKWTDKHSFLKDWLWPWGSLAAKVVASHQRR